MRQKEWASRIISRQKNCLLKMKKAMHYLRSNKQVIILMLKNR